MDGSQGAEEALSGLLHKAQKVLDLNGYRSLDKIPHKTGLTIKKL